MLSIKGFREILGTEPETWFMIYTYTHLLTAKKVWAISVKIEIYCTQYMLVGYTITTYW